MYSSGILELPPTAMQESLGGAAACSTLGLLLKGMLAALSNPATAAQLLAEGASIAARPAQPSVGRPEGGSGRKAAGPRPLVIQLKPRGTLKSKPDALEASGDTAVPLWACGGGATSHRADCPGSLARRVLCATCAVGKQGATPALRRRCDADAGSYWGELLSVLSMSDP